MIDPVFQPVDDALDGTWQHLKRRGIYRVAAVLSGVKADLQDEDRIALDLRSEDRSRIETRMGMEIPHILSDGTARIPVLVQRSVVGSGPTDFVLYVARESGMFFLRPRSEFLDGRFARL